MKDLNKIFKLALIFIIFASVDASANEFLVYDGTRTYTESNRGFLYFDFEQDLAPADWTTPDDFYNGKFYVRFEILDLPTTEPLQLSICIWQNGWFDVETCSPQININNAEGVYSNNSTVANWWKKDGKAIDFTSPGTIQSFGVAMWNETGTCNISDYMEPNCWDQRVDHLPMEFRITVVAVSTGSTFSGWENYVGSNNKPSITSTPETAVDEDSLYQYQVTATDPNSGDVLSYSLDIAPEWMSIDNMTGLISGTPLNEHVGDTIIQVKAQDDKGGFDTQNYALSVINTNDDPTISEVVDTIATEGTPYQGQIIATDVDPQDTLTYSLTVKPDWLEIDSLSGLMSGTPLDDHVGANSVEVTVKDVNGGTAARSFSIDVEGTNSKPVIVNLPDQIEITNNGPHTENMDNYVEDPDNDDIELTWSFASSDESLIIGYNSATRVLTLTAPDFTGSVTLTCTVKDPEGKSDTKELTVIVTTVTAISEFDLNDISGFALHQNYPNPFNESTTIPFSLSENINVKISVYNLFGEEIEILYHGTKRKGNHEIVYKPTKLREGIYLYQIQYGNQKKLGKMILKR